MAVGSCCYGNSHIFCDKKRKKNEFAPAGGGDSRSKLRRNGSLLLLASGNQKARHRIRRARECRLVTIWLLMSESLTQFFGRAASKFPKAPSTFAANLADITGERLGMRRRRRAVVGVLSRQTTIELYTHF